MPGLCQRAWLLLVLLVALLTWHIRPQHGRVAIDTQPSRDHAIAARTPGAPALPRSQPQQHDSAPEPRAAPEQLPEWAVDHEPRTRSLLRLYPRLAATRSQRLRSVPSIDALGGCPGNCSGHGQCQSQRGTAGAWSTRCACAPGWNGTACEVRDASPEQVRGALRRGRQPVLLRRGRALPLAADAVVLLRRRRERHPVADARVVGLRARAQGALLGRLG